MTERGIEKSVWVVFTGKTDIKWLKILKSGFRHCFALLHDGKTWITIDPLSAYTDIEIHHHIAADYDLPRWLRGQGFKVTAAYIDHDHKNQAPCMIYSCVESVKRVLGIHNRFIITPWQLYKFLNQDNTNTKNSNSSKGKSYG